MAKTAATVLLLISMAAVLLTAPCAHSVHTHPREHIWRGFSENERWAYIYYNDTGLGLEPVGHVYRRYIGKTYFYDSYYHTIESVLVLNSGKTYTAYIYLDDSGRRAGVEYSYGDALLGEVYSPHLDGYYSHDLVVGESWTEVIDIYNSSDSSYIDTIRLRHTVLRRETLYVNNTIPIEAYRVLREVYTGYTWVPEKTLWVSPDANGIVKAETYRYGYGENTSVSAKMELISYSGFSAPAAASGGQRDEDGEGDGVYVLIGAGVVLAGMAGAAAVTYLVLASRRREEKTPPPSPPSAEKPSISAPGSIWGVVGLVKKLRVRCYGISMGEVVAETPWGRVASPVVGGEAVLPIKPGGPGDHAVTLQCIDGSGHIVATATTRLTAVVPEISVSPVSEPRLVSGRESVAEYVVSTNVPARITVTGVNASVEPREFVARPPETRVSLRVKPLGPGAAEVVFRTRLGEVSRHRLEVGEEEPTAIPVRPAVAIPGYEVIGKLGEGGFSIVYKARRRETGDIVALKIPRIEPGETMAAQLMEGFRREAETWSRLKHPNIVEVIEYGLKPIPFLAIEYMPGGSLRDMLAQGRPRSLRDALRIAVEVAEALAYAHHYGVVHRDVKPENILFTSDGRAKVSDFGLAKVLLEASMSSSGAGFKGTLLYAAPEQLDPETFGGVDWRTDIWQYGAVLYEMLTHRPPFRSDSPVHLIALITGREPVPPHRVNPSVPIELSKIVMKCLRKQKEERWRSMDIVAEVLRRIVDELGEKR